MIEIITEKIKVITLQGKDKRFIKKHLNNKWVVLDTDNEDNIIYRGSFEDASLACYNLNKKHYRDST